MLDIKKEYMVVYNGQKNPESTTRIGAIQAHLQALPIRFGLERYKGTFFDSISTVSDSTFMNRIVPQLTPIATPSPDPSSVPSPEQDEMVEMIQEEKLREQRG